MKNKPSFCPLALFLALATFSVLPAIVGAQTCTFNGADAVGSAFTQVENYASLGGIEAFSVGLILCNIGNAPVDFDSTTNRHPVLTQGLYRYKSVGPEGNARFEQIGQGWCYHPLFALSENGCCTGACVGTDGMTLGVRCADPQYATFMAGQLALGPKWQVNAATGVFPTRPANPPYSGSVARRLQARISDLDPAQHGGAQYFAEVVVVSNSDAAASNHHNNASHRPVNITGSDSAWSLALAGTTRRERAAIQAWRMIDPDVREAAIFVPGDGWFLIAGRASQIDAKTWHYEYAVENLSSDRSGQAFHVPVPPSVVVTNVGFHDVDYTDGDGPGNVNFSGTDWPGVVSDASLSWATQTFAENQSANALRWGTLYNFRFDASAPPVPGTVTMDLFKPGSPGAFEVQGLPVPSRPPCPADWNEDGAADSQDFFDFVAAFFLLEPAADFNDDSVINSQDFFDFVTAFLAGCP